MGLTTTNRRTSDTVDWVSLHGYYMANPQIPALKIAEENDVYPAQMYYQWKKLGLPLRGQPPGADYTWEFTYLMHQDYMSSPDDVDAVAARHNVSRHTMYKLFARFDLLERRGNGSRSHRRPLLQTMAKLRRHTNEICPVRKASEEQENHFSYTFCTRCPAPPPDECVSWHCTTCPHLVGSCACFSAELRQAAGWAQVHERWQRNNYLNVKWGRYFAEQRQNKS